MGTFRAEIGITPSTHPPSSHDASVRITAIEPQRKDPERVNLFVDDEFRCGVAAELLYSANLRVGDTISPETLEELEEEDLLWKARQIALNLLAYRARTAEELRRRLVRRDIPDATARACVEDFEEKGYVDDAEFAETFTRERLRTRPRGPRRIAQELRARGVDEQTAEAAIEKILDELGLEEIEIARNAARQWRRRTPRPPKDAAPDKDTKNTQRRRLHGYLARRGFTGETIWTVMDEFITTDAD